MCDMLFNGNKRWTILNNPAFSKAFVCHRRNTKLALALRLSKDKSNYECKIFIANFFIANLMKYQGTGSLLNPAIPSFFYLKSL